MSRPSTQHLRDLASGADRPRYAQEAIQRIMTFGLPPYEREQFFPNAYVRPEEADIISRSPDFVDRGSVHLLMQRLAQNSKVAHDVRSKINANRAALFFPACVQRKPPPSTQPDPVVEYGWDRTRDKDLVQNMQDQCARLFLECDRLAFMAATPEMAQYCRDQPADWYQRLTSHLTSPTYKIDLKAKMKAGIEPVRDLLSNLFTKLVILHEAAGGDAAGPKPQDVMGELCTRVGIPALSELDLNDEAKEEIRNLLESIRDGAKRDANLDFQFTLYGVMPLVFRLDIIAAFDNALDIVSSLKGLWAVIPSPAAMVLPGLAWLRDKFVEGQVAERVTMLGRRTGRKYGLWYD